MNHKKPTVAVIGATGAVGSELVRLLLERKFPFSNLRLFASAQSVGKKVHSFRVEQLEHLEGIDLAFFCAGAAVSKKWIPQASCLCIDSSSAFRTVAPLVIPEINPHAIQGPLIASPNCAVTLLLLPLFSLHRLFRVKRIVVSTYQAASGAGAHLLHQLQEETRAHLEKRSYTESDSKIGRWQEEALTLSQAKPSTKQLNLNKLSDAVGLKGSGSSTQPEPIFESRAVYPHSLPFPYAFNLFPHNSALHPNGYVEEELKMVYETRKILEDDAIQLSATCVRVPVLRAHSLAANVEFRDPFSLSQIYAALKNVAGLKVFEDRAANRFPTPHDATGQLDILCGRFRIDPSQPNTLEFWAVGDQLLKGAALNAVQIAEHCQGLFTKNTC